MELQKWSKIDVLLRNKSSPQEMRPPASERQDLKFTETFEGELVTSNHYSLPGLMQDTDIVNDFLFHYSSHKTKISAFHVLLDIYENCSNFDLFLKISLVK